MTDLATLMHYGAFLPDHLDEPFQPGGDLQRAILDAVAEALQDAPRPIAVALSGGVDSTVVAAVAKRVAPIHAFALDTGRAVAEATPIARHLGVPLEVIPLPDGVRVTTPADVAAALGCPTHSAAPFGFLALYRALAAHGIRTVLTGDGADEVFAGHAYHRTPPKDWPDIWPTWRRVRALGMNPEQLLTHQTEPWVDRAAAHRVAREARAIPDSAARLRHLDIRLRMGPQCVDLQRALVTACGMAYRAPLANPRVIRAALTHPVEPDRPKAPLRALAATLVGPTPPKQPMYTPTGGQALDEHWLKWLTPQQIHRTGLFRPEPLRRLVEGWSPTQPYIPRALVVAATTHAWLAHSEKG